MSLATVLVLGFFLGMRHATDADHVVAVSAIVSRERTLRAAAPVGVAWGVGHTATIILVGGAIVLFGFTITPRLGLGMELAVAMMLIVLGAINLRSILREARKLAEDRAHGHAHALGDSALGSVDRWFGASRGYRLLRPLVVGVVHGLAGSAAVTLLVLGTVRGAWAALVYLFTFGLGTIAGMLLITLAFATPLALTAQRFGRLNRSLTVAASMLSVGFGGYLVYEVGFVHGLFTSHPQWTPQ